MWILQKVKKKIPFSTIFTWEGNEILGNIRRLGNILQMALLDQNMLQKKKEKYTKIVADQKV